MDLYKEILSEVLSREEISVTFPNLSHYGDTIVEMKSYEALKKIKAVIKDDNLQDCECFTQIEEIINIFEQLGSSGGNRHDYG